MLATREHFIYSTSLFAMGHSQVYWYMHLWIHPCMAQSCAWKSRCVALHLNYKFNHILTLDIRIFEHVFSRSDRLALSFKRRSKTFIFAHPLYVWNTNLNYFLERHDQSAWPLCISALTIWCVSCLHTMPNCDFAVIFKPLGHSQQTNIHISNICRAPPWFKGLNSKGTMFYTRLRCCQQGHLFNFYIRTMDTYLILDFFRATRDICIFYTSFALRYSYFIHYTQPRDALSGNVLLARSVQVNDHGWMFSKTNSNHSKRPFISWGILSMTLVYTRQTWTWTHATIRRW